MVTIETENNGRDGNVPAKENKELEWAQRHVPETPDSTEKPEEIKKVRNRLVERATALRGLPISAPRRKKSALRKQTEQDLRGRDPEVPCLKTENAIRDLVCSLMERQDRMNEEIFLKINDLGYRLEDLETELSDLWKGR